MGLFQRKRYAIDFSHSTIDFSVRHMMVSKIYGESYIAEIAMPDIKQMEDVKISFTIAVANVSTKNFDRDVHLVSPTFFDADIYPKNLFTSTYIEKLEDKKFTLNGYLTNQLCLCIIP
ncbi:YceI family protein [Lysinibacillus sp. NPDC094403]|uniref:YceI family protein n=1 Tax=Lysinibacillus sp. NPDC094403 TaxID=3390581 RepID=UPI003D04F60C